MKRALAILFVAFALSEGCRQAAAQTTLERRVSADDDDAEQETSPGDVDLDSSDLELAVDPFYDTDIVGMRFRNVTVPQGASITNAYIQFTVEDGDTTGAAALTLWGQDIDDAPIFSDDDYDISSRTPTTATVAWSPPEWPDDGEAGLDQRTPDISAIIQEIVGRAGWVSGNDLVIILNGTGERAAESHDGNSSRAPLLHFEYGPGVISHHWAFDETSGTTAADSISSSDGTLWGFPVDDSQWTCENGGSLIFDGVDDFVSLSTESDFDFTDAVTVAAWIQVTSFGVAEQAIVTKGDTAWRLERNASTNAVQFAVDGLMTNAVVQGSVSVNDGGWHHVAGVYDGAQLLLYVDGQLDNSVTATGTMDMNAADVYFGDNAEVSGRSFSGRMKDVYIYDTGLNAASILALAQQSQLGWWKVDETSGTTASDSGTYGNNGTLTNMDGSEWTTGRVDNGLDFDGSEDYIETNVPSNQAATVTMMAWFKSDDAGTIGDDRVAQRFLTQRRSSSSSRLALGINFDRVAVYWRDGGNNTQETTTALTAGVWYHAALTYDGATIRAYVNGVEEDNWAEASMAAPSTNTFRIAVESSSRYFDGVLDDVRLYSRALCAAEIALIHAQGARGVRIVSWQEVDPHQ